MGLIDHHMVIDLSEDERAVRGGRQQDQSCLTLSFPEHQPHPHVLDIEHGSTISGDIGSAWT